MTVTRRTLGGLSTCAELFPSKRNDPRRRAMATKSILTLHDGTHFLLVRCFCSFSFFGVLLVLFLLSFSFELLRGFRLAGEPAHGARPSGPGGWWWGLPEPWSSFRWHGCPCG